MIGIIGGSGVYTVAKTMDERKIFTPFGVTTVEKVRFANRKTAWFIPRHGKNHTLPPHKVNYKANIYALKKLGASSIFGTYAVGAITKYKIGDLVLLDDFIGLNIGITFFNSFAKGLRHTNVCEPYSRQLQKNVLEIAKVKRIPVKKNGVVFTTHGPRYETRAEIKAIKKLGANLVSMTASYEAILANEMEIPLLGMAIVTNYACGIRRSKPKAEEVLDIVNKKIEKINNILIDVV